MGYKPIKSKKKKSRRKKSKEMTVDAKLNKLE